MDYGEIRVAIANDATKLPYIDWKNIETIWFKKYSIKETDMRVKTASFTTPHYYDLTTGLRYVLIKSKYHENFAGVILDVEYDEKEGLYTYQCQDWSRLYISKFYMVTKNIELYRILQNLLSRGEVSLTEKITSKTKKKYKKIWSGLKEKGLYEQSLYKGNGVKGNPMTQKIPLIAKDKSIIEVIRGLMYSHCRWSDIWFSDAGALQITPLSRTDWENTGLHLTADDFTNRKFKFSTVNAITNVIVNPEEINGSTVIGSKDGAVRLNLQAFFGKNSTSINSEKSNAVVKSNTKTKKKTTTKKTTSNKDGNPYGKKKKKIWIGADGGSGDFAKSVIKTLKKHGWKCHYSGANSEVHYWDVFKVKKDYQVLAIVDNGFDPMCVKEIYDAGNCRNTLNKKNITYMFMFDTRSWNHEFKPYKYGNFKKFKCGRAHDDGYSNYHGTMNVYNYFKKHKAKYCCHPKPSGVAEQFLKGGLMCK